MSYIFSWRCFLFGFDPPSVALEGSNASLTSNFNINRDIPAAAGELVFHVFAAIAHFEKWLISERTKVGLLAARKRGRAPGRPPLHADTVSALQELVNNGSTPRPHNISGSEDQPHTEWSGKPARSDHYCSGYSLK